MTITVVLRAYSPADEAACLAVFDSNVPDYFVASERDEFRAFLRSLPGPYVVMSDVATGAVVGCGGYAINADTGDADLCWGMVRRDLHRHGLGRRLTQLRLDEIRREPHARSVRLQTSQHTRSFYERLGFVVLEVVADAFGPGLDRCEMRLQLG